MVPMGSGEIIVGHDAFGRAVRRETVSGILNTAWIAVAGYNSSMPFKSRPRH